MAQIKLAEIRPSGTIEGKVDALYDAYFMMRKQMMYYLSGALDSENIHSITTDQLIAGKAKIGSALIDELTVGTNVGLGSALDETGVTTIVGGMITTDYIKALGLEVGDHINMGANATISWSRVTNQPYIPTTADITQITANYVATPNLVTNIAQVSNYLSVGSSSVDGTIRFKSGALIQSFDSFGASLLYSANIHRFDWGSQIDFTRCNNVDFTGTSVIGLSLPPHTHDDRYFTETEANARFIRPYYGSSNYCYLDYGGGSTIIVRNSSGTYVGMIQLT